MKFKEHLENINACSPAINWVNDRGIKKAFKECQRGNWMLWYAYKNRERLGLEDMKLITLAKVKCARLAQHLMRDERSLKALDVAEKFAQGKATEKELADAADAAYAAVDAAYDDAAYDNAADAATIAAAIAAYTDAADAAVADAVAYAITKRKETLAKCADICREIFKDVKLKF
ncbi:MAG: hypothetical protein ACTSRA_20425 [Promethearchaeota archaeon]